MASTGQKWGAGTLGTPRVLQGSVTQAPGQGAWSPARRRAGKGVG